MKENKKIKKNHHRSRGHTESLRHAISRIGAFCAGVSLEKRNKTSSVSVCLWRAAQGR